MIQGSNALAVQQTYSLQAQQAFSESLFERFIDYTDRKDSTVKGYLTCIRQFIKWLHENNIQQPQREDIKAYRSYLKDRGDLAPSTQSQYLRAVKHFFRWTAAEGLYPNVADNLHGQKISRTHKKDALQRDDVAKIADSIDRTDEQGKRIYCMYMLCITCGLRCVELHRADVQDIKTTGDRCYLWIQGKGRDQKDSPVLIIPEVKEALTDYLETRETKAIAKSPLFTSTSNRSKGKRIAETTISTMLKDLLVSAGYDSDRLTPHSLRHTSGTGAYKATGNLFLAQKHQRHASPETTQIYVHAEEREERQTEQQVYDYYFKDETQSKAAEAARLLQLLDDTKLDKVIEFINLIK